MKIPILSLLTLLVLFSSVTISQSQINPFELPDSPDYTIESTSDTVNSNNPFEISKSRNANRLEKPTEGSVALEDKSADSTEIGIAIFLLIFLSFLLTLFRGLFQDFFDSVIRDRKFNQIFRRMDGIWGFPNLLFYTYFALSLATFAFSSAHYFDFWTEELTHRTILLIAGLIGAFFLGKHLIIENLGRIFGIENEANRYSLQLMMFMLILGILVTPFNIMILLGPDSFKGATIIFGIILIALILGLFLMRALSIANRFLTQNTFHFFMYLCTIEIAPLFIIAKMMM